MAEQAKVQGLYLGGPIVHKEHTPAQGNQKDRFQFHVLVPGQSNLFIVTVNADDFMKKNIGDDFQSYVNVRSYKDRLYWQPAAK